MFLCHPRLHFWLGMLSLWCKFSSLYAFCVGDLLIIHKTSHGSEKKVKAFYTIILTSMWCIWRMRNDVVFNRKPASIAKVVEEIKTMGFLSVRTVPRIPQLHGGDVMDMMTLLGLIPFS